MGPDANDFHATHLSMDGKGVRWIEREMGLLPKRAQALSGVWGWGLAGEDDGEA